MSKNNIQVKMLEAHEDTGAKKDERQVHLLFEVFVRTEWENLKYIKEDRHQINYEDFAKLLKKTIRPKKTKANISKEWLDANLNFSGHWFTKDIGSKYRPLKIIVHNSSEVKGGWYIALWDESEEVTIFDGKNYSIERFKRLYMALSGKELIEK